MMKRHFFAAVLSAVIASVWIAPIAAQVTTGTIVGTVTDSNGVVPGASVVIHEVNRGTSDTVVTDAGGSYARLGAHGIYWTATESDSEHAWFYNFGRLGLNRHRGGNKSMAVSVRCIEGQ